MENGYHLYDFKGEQLREEHLDKFKQWQWRPRPPTLLTKEEQKQIRITLAAMLNGVVCQRLVPRRDGPGRVLATEVAVNSGLVAEAIADPAKTGTIRDLVAHGAYHGMHTFHQDLVRLLEDGVVSWEDARAAATDPHDLEVDVRRAGLLSLTMAE